MCNSRKKKLISWIIFHHCNKKLLLNYFLKKEVHYVNINILPYECGVIDIHKRCHKELTIEPVHQPSMTRNSVSKILTKSKKCLNEWGF